MATKEVPCRAQDKAKCRYHLAKSRMEQALAEGDMQAFFTAQEDLLAATKSPEYKAEVESFFAVRQVSRQRIEDIKQKFRAQKQDAASDRFATPAQKRERERSLGERERAAQAYASGLEMLELMAEGSHMEASEFMSALAESHGLSAAQNVFYSLERNGKLHYSLGEGTVSRAN